MHARRRRRLFVKHHSYKCLLLTLISILLVIATGLSGCAKPAPAPAPTPTPTPIPMPTPAPTNSESASQIAELEAKIRQLEAENQRLLAENRQLSSDLAKTTSMLQSLYSLVTSPPYTNTVSKLSEIQYDTSDLAAFVRGLPDLPPLPPGLTVSQINNAINDGRYLRRLLRDLPDLPPPLWPPFVPFPQELLELDNMRHTFIDMTEWMENLRDLPGFLESAGSLEDLRFRLEGYLLDVGSTSSDAKGILEQVKDAASP